MPQRITYIPSPTGQAFHSAVLGTYLYKGIRGVPGSGKTVACVWDMFYKSNMQPPVQDPVTGKMVRWSRWLVVRQTNHDLLQSTIPTWLNWFPTVLTDIHKSYPIEGCFEAPSIRNDGTLVRMELVFLPAEADGFMNFMDGIELSGAYVNEAAQVEWKKIHKIQERVGRFKPQGGAASGMKFLSFGVIMDTNTPLETSWYYRLEQVEAPDRMLWYVQPPAMIKTKDGLGNVRYVRNDEENSRKYGTSGPCENVEHHNDGWDYYEKQLVGADEDYIKMRLLNEYGRQKGGLAVYAETWNDSFHVVRGDMEWMKRLVLGIGMDFGRNPAATIGQLTPMGQMRVYRELPKFNMSVPVFFEDYLLPLLMNEFDWPNCRLIVFGDPSGENGNEMSELGPIGWLNARGIPAMIPPILVGKNNDITIRLNAVEKFLRGNRGGVPDFQLSSKCEMLRDGFNGDYCYAKMRTAAGTNEKYAPTPDKGSKFSHVHDSLQYLACGFSGPIPDVGQYGRPQISVESLKMCSGCI